MRDILTTWNKTELKIYMLCLCAKVDLVETEGELEIIKSKTDKATLIKFMLNLKKITKI